MIGAEARAHLHASGTAALATLSVDRATEGFPFGSVVPYALDEEGRPLIFISDIAQHTRNLKADPRASLLVRAEAKDAQAAWRVTVIGEMAKVHDERAHARYVARVPDAPSYTATHGFDLWRMDVTRVRFIGGFGKIHWIEPADYLRAEGHGGFAEAGPGMITHMNEDHADALLDYCRGLRGVSPARAELVGVEAAGFFVRTEGPDGLLYFPFGREIEAKDARASFVALLKAARDSLS